MQKLWSRWGVTAVFSFVVWLTIITSRTDAFARLAADPVRTSAIVGAAIAMGLFGWAMARLFEVPDDDVDDDETPS